MLSEEEVIEIATRQESTIHEYASVLKYLDRLPTMQLWNLINSGHSFRPIYDKLLSEVLSRAVRSDKNLRAIQSPLGVNTN